MDHLDAKLSFAFILAVLLSVLGAWGLAHRYRVAMRRMMSAPLAAPTTSTTSTASTASASTASASVPARDAASPAPIPGVSAEENRRAAWVLTWLLCAFSLLMSASTAALQHTILFGAGEFAPKRVAVLVVMQAWPVVPLLGLVWRWSRGRIIAVMAGWFAVAYLVMLWRSIEPQPLFALFGLAVDFGPPMVLIGAIFLSNATRAVAPWLFPLMLGFATASLIGGELLLLWLERHREVLYALLGGLGATAVFVLAFVLPWFVVWWPLRAFGRMLSRAYESKHLSELAMLLTAVWGIALCNQWNTMSGEGPAGAVMLLPLAWIPLALYIGGRLTRADDRAPTLLVLRVFQRDRQVQELFDTVIERWRPSGNTVLIAGTDLVERTLGADDVFAFLDRRLVTRFIREPGDVAARIAGFDLRRDHDGRYRVNECYCHDSTWQAALAALVRHSDVVLMDLRGYQAHNAGCGHELGVLARASRLARVVVLIDAHTDRAAAAAACAGAPAGRFVWLDTPRIDRRHARHVLKHLFAPTASPVRPSVAASV